MSPGYRGKEIFMNRNLTPKPGDGSDGSPPTEAWLFAQAILGKPIPGIVSPEAKARAEREELERLTGFSTRHAEELRRLQAAEAEARHDREILEWAAQISTRAEDKLRALQGKEDEEREAWRRAEQFTQTLLEGSWDPSKQPRAPKGQPDGGQWIGMGGGAGEGSIAATGTPATTASYSGPKKVDAQQVSWHPLVGHHWAPYSVVFQPDIRRLLSDDAIAYAMGAYSGPTDPAHGNGTYGGITHPEYNQKVNEQLKEFIKARKIKKMTAEQMEEFVSLINNGLGANGKAHDEIAAFNKAIRATLPKGATASSKMEDILAAGRKYMKTSRFRLLAAGAVVSGLLGELLQKHVDALNVAAKSKHYQRALRALQDGDVAKAHALLTGDRDSLYMEILLQVGFQAAANFKIAMDKVFETAHNRVYK
jgi:hypothetical protein